MTTVHNLLDVALPSEDYETSAALAGRSNNELAASPDVPESVEASASEGNVSLNGTVNSPAQPAAAENAVTGCAGVLSISNEIQVLSGL